MSINNSEDRQAKKLGQQANLGNISVRPEYAYENETVTIDIVVENNSLVDTPAYPRVILQEDDVEFNTIEGPEKDVYSGTEKTWTIDFDMPAHDVGVTVELIDVNPAVIGNEVEDSSDKYIVEFVPEDEPKPDPDDRDWREIARNYGVPMAIGGAVGFGTAEFYDEPKLPIVILGAGGGASTRYIMDQVGGGYQEIPGWQIAAIPASLGFTAVIVSQLFG